MESLEEMRKSVDNIDSAIVAMLAERFKVTSRIGVYKARNRLPAKDGAREELQYRRIIDLAEQHGLDPEFAKSYLDVVLHQVVRNHEQAALLLR